MTVTMYNTTLTYLSMHTIRRVMCIKSTQSENSHQLVHMCLPRYVTTQCEAYLGLHDCVKYFELGTSPLPGNCRAHQAHS
jgi:hypothetical protein